MLINEQHKNYSQSSLESDKVFFTTAKSNQLIQPQVNLPQYKDNTMSFQRSLYKCSLIKAYQFVQKDLANCFAYYFFLSKLHVKKRIIKLLFKRSYSTFLYVIYSSSLSFIQTLSKYIHTFLIKVMLFFKLLVKIVQFCSDFDQLII